MIVTVRLNGTDKNPFEKMGLHANPFGQINKAELRHVDVLLNDLHARPIKDRRDLRKRLQGCTPEFIEGCITRFKKGQMVRFVVEFPTP